MFRLKKKKKKKKKILLTSNDKYIIFSELCFDKKTVKRDAEERPRPTHFPLGYSSGHTIEKNTREPSEWSLV